MIASRQLYRAAITAPAIAGTPSTMSDADPEPDECATTCSSHTYATGTSLVMLYATGTSLVMLYAADYNTAWDAPPAPPPAPRYPRRQNIRRPADSPRRPHRSKSGAFYR